MHLTLQSVCPVMIIVFFLYKKIKRSIGYQPLRPRWLFIRVILFSLFAGGLAVFSLTHPFLYAYLTLGILGGFLLVFFAKRNISFEKRRGKIYFRTHIWVELILLSLFLSRFLYRVSGLYLAHPDLKNPDSYSQTIGTDPLTICIFFLIAVYYIGFSSFVLKMTRHDDDENQTSQYG
ncbi:kinase [Bacillus atrophaeus]|uniref:kinase n=1 Tax=Bacillus atrophaeus TaxID=1452 RepID=UPI00227F7F5E|nr:kinase [Bacillus atrophaeus]MCY8945681.1 kinase [Bacillus atrophaeus]